MGTLADRLAAGDKLPPFTRATDFPVWNRYAAVNYEFVPIHMDDAAGRQAGLPGAIGMGNLQWSYLHNLVRDWLGDEGRIVHMDCQFRSPNERGQTVTARGVVAGVTRGDTGTEAQLDVWTEAVPAETGDAETGTAQRLAIGHCVVLLGAAAIRHDMKE
jgi:acyl dehydratase